MTPFNVLLPILFDLEHGFTLTIPAFNCRVRMHIFNMLVKIFALQIFFSTDLALQIAAHFYAFKWIFTVRITDYVLRSGFEFRAAGKKGGSLSSSTVLIRLGSK